MRSSVRSYADCVDYGLTEQHQFSRVTSCVQREKKYTFVLNKYFSFINFQFPRCQFAVVAAVIPLTRKSTILAAARRVFGRRGNLHCVIVVCNGDGIVSQALLEEKFQRGRCQGTIVVPMLQFGWTDAIQQQKREMWFAKHASTLLTRITVAGNFLT